MPESKNAQRMMTHQKATGDSLTNPENMSIKIQLILEQCELNCVLISRYFSVVNTTVLQSVVD